MHTVHQIGKVALFAAILVLSFPFTFHVTGGAVGGQAHCATDDCRPEPGSICETDGNVIYNAYKIGEDS